MDRYRQVLAHIDPRGINTRFNPIAVGDLAQIEAFREQFNNKDLYLTPNYFNEFATTHKSEYVALIKQLTIDFDLRLLANDIETKKGITNHLAEASQRNEIPQIHRVVSSGRGLYIVFMIDDETNLKAYNSIGTALAKKIDTILADYSPLLSIDPRNKKMDYQTLQAQWIFRLEGSINSKSGEVVETLYNGHRETPYSFRELAKYLNYTEKQTEYILNSFGSYQVTSKYRQRLKHLPKHFTEASLYYARVSDLETLQALRKARNYHIGYRNTLLFYYGVALRIQLQDTRDIERFIREFNKGFKYPLKEAEIRATIKSVSTTKYNATNQTMIDKLDIWKSEQRVLKTIIGYSVKRERNRARDNKAYKCIKEEKQRSRGARNGRIVEMKQNNPNITLQEIADLMGVNKSTVSRVLKKANS